VTLCGGQDFMNLQVVDKRALVTGASAGTDVAIAEVLSAIPRSKSWAAPFHGAGTDTATQETTQ
jgi:hypothetical protein